MAGLFFRAASAALAVSGASLLFFSCASAQIPFEAEARRNNDAIRAYQEGQRLEAAGKYEEALAVYADALPYAQTHDAALYKRGRLACLCGDWELAEAAFTLLLQDDPENTSVRQSLAYVYCQGGREAEGLAAYRALHEEKPHDELIFQGYIKALKLNGLEEEAQEAEAEFDRLFPHLMSK